MPKLSHASIQERARRHEVSIAGVEPELLRRLYRFMLRLRRCEQALLDEYHPADEMRCPVHFCLGQEAAPAALAALLQPDDYLFSHHRSHGYYLAKNGPMKLLFAELFGKATGANGGKAGSQEISLPEQRFFGGAILAGPLAIAAGAALGLQLQQQPGIAVAGFGEAATEEGVFWETVNYAVVRKLPLVLVCENNKYSTFSPQTNRQPADNLAERVRAFGMSAESLFGNDVVAVHAALKSAVARARQGAGPTFVEAYTYRWNAHVGPEDDLGIGYRTQEELDFWRELCPLRLLDKPLRAQGIVDDALFEAWAAAIDHEIAEAFAFARTSPFPENTGWACMNLSDAAPLAERLLIEHEADRFDQNQEFAVPGPY